MIRVTRYSSRSEGTEPRYHVIGDEIRKQSCLSSAVPPIYRNARLFPRMEDGVGRQGETKGTDCLAETLKPSLVLGKSPAERMERYPDQTVGIRYSVPYIRSQSSPPIIETSIAPSDSRTCNLKGVWISYNFRDTLSCSCKQA